MRKVIRSGKVWLCAVAGIIFLATGQGCQPPDQNVPPTLDGRWTVVETPTGDRAGQASRSSILTIENGVPMEWSAGSSGLLLDGQDHTDSADLTLTATGTLTQDGNHVQVQVTMHQNDHGAISTNVTTWDGTLQDDNTIIGTGTEVQTYTGGGYTNTNQVTLTRQ